MIKYREPFLLSSSGSTRATAYGFSNKSVTMDGKTHVVWLDAVAQVCGRTYDHATGTWGETLQLFEGCDNHTTPCLSVDKDKHLRLVYGPHGWWGDWNEARFMWVRSEEPNRIGAWRDEVAFGYNATYSCMVHTPADLDVIVYRGGEYPPSLMFQKQRAKGGWTSAKGLFRQEIAPQYTHVNATAACAADGTLYVAGHLYNIGFDYGFGNLGKIENMKTGGTVIIKSADLGESWTDLKGEPVRVPALYDERYSVPPVPPFESTRYLDGLAVDSAGSVWALVNCTELVCRDILLSRWTGDDWQTVNVAPFLPAGRSAVDCVMTIDSADRIHIALNAVLEDYVKDASDDGTWGNPTAEIFHLVSRDAGATFECNQVSIADDSLPNWLPNISRGGVYNPVEKPVILYTHGSKGEGCSPETKTEAYCVLIEDME